MLVQQEKIIGLTAHKTILFTADELEKVINNFNVGRVLDRGVQCLVYKSLLTNGRIVAIKSLLG